jgi:hypothetical protein
MKSANEQMDMRLRIDGDVEQALELSRGELALIDAASQVPDMSRAGPKRKGKAVKLAALLAAARPKTTLHPSGDALL